MVDGEQCSPLFNILGGNVSPQRFRFSVLPISILYTDKDLEVGSGERGGPNLHSVPIPTAIQSKNLNIFKSSANLNS